MIDWEKFLMKWAQQIVRIPEYRDRLPSDVLKSGWLGYPGALEADIKNCEVRIGKTLPHSYREFLKITNGWQMVGDFVGPLWPAQKIEWLAKNQRELIDNWMKGYYYSGKPPRVSDTEYFKYGDKQNSFSFLIREEYLSKTLEISDMGNIDNTAVYLLNPEIIGSDNEWEAWYFEPELGVRRYRSFEYLMEGEYKWFCQSNGLS
jgi:hypothetical protein